MSLMVEIYMYTAFLSEFLWENSIKSCLADDKKAKKKFVIYFSKKRSKEIFYVNKLEKHSQNAT